jgi:hypothetical protein
MALTKVGKEGITGISNSSDATAITIDSSENVGIGVSSPGRFVHLEDGSDTTLHLTTSSTGSTGNDGTSLFVDGTAASLWQRENDYLRFATNNTERMRIDSSGRVLVGKTTNDFNTAGINLRPVGAAEFVRDADEPLLINRTTNDGVLVRFYQAGTGEGTISVSGTTVSYNGGHLARFSQATDGNRIDGLVKGTVMTNLDQMAVWTKDGVTEDNEQLNCMAVSSVEGDANVAGVFVNWDDDDEDYTSDMNIAMTGDMVIRIASGTTVARGDLLMSAGDGTAKPQDDDIVRSKTIAKVTSTTKSHTYDDGSYLVPCVLMAC